MVSRLRAALTVLAGLFLLLTTAIAAAGSAQAADSATGSIGVRLLDAPTSPADPHARLYIVNRLAPGATVTRRVELSNTSTHPVSVEVYASAATVTKGAFTWADGKAANELSSWTSLNQPTITVPGGGRVIETVHIQVPDRVSTGERYGVIWAQVASKPAASGGARLVNRVGVRMYVSVGDGNVGAANFALSQIAGQRGSKGLPSVTATVANTGGRALDLTGTLSLTKGPGGISTGPFKVTNTATIAAGQSGHITVTLNKDLPDGPWTAKLTLTAAAVTKQLTGPVQFVAADGLTSIVKIALIVCGAVLLILLIILTDRLRRRRRPAQHYGTPAVNLHAGRSSSSVS
jgi:hypothetical protein